MEAFVINLDRSPERLAHMEREFSRIGARFVRLRAVDGALLSDEERMEFARRRRRTPVDEWLPGEIGCFLSHFKAWQTIASGDEEAGAVFEDDVYLARDLATLLAKREWLPDKADIIRLEATRKTLLRAGRHIEGSSRRRVYRVDSGTWGGGGYILTKNAAKRIVESPPELQCEADVFLFKPTRSLVAAGLRRYQVVPAVCIQAQLLQGAEQFPSTIGGARKPPRVTRRPLARLLPWKKRPVPFRV